MLKNIGKQNTCLFCLKSTTGKSYSFSGKAFQLCECCESKLSFITDGLDKEYVHEAIDVNEDELPFDGCGYYDENEIPTDEIPVEILSAFTVEADSTIKSLPLA